MKKRKSEFTVLAGVTSAALALLALTAGYSQFRGEKVVEVIDGDTFRIENKQIIRLYNVDAPETGLCMSQKAKQRLSDLILKKRIHLRDIHSAGFSRVMGYTYVGNTFVDAEMLRSGLGIPMRGTGEIPELSQAKDYARAHSLGVFSPECYQTVNTIDPDCNIKGNIGATKNDRHYFVPSCPNYSQSVVWLSYGDRWFCTEKEAQAAGFTKGPMCK